MSRPPLLSVIDLFPRRTTCQHLLSKQKTAEKYLAVCRSRWAAGTAALPRLRGGGPPSRTTLRALLASVPLATGTPWDATLTRCGPPGWVAPVGAPPLPRVAALLPLELPVVPSPSFPSLPFFFFRSFLSTFHKHVFQCAVEPPHSACAASCVPERVARGTVPVACCRRDGVDLRCRRFFPALSPTLLAA